MQTREIPHNQWRSFFNDLSTQHRGHPIELCVRDAGADQRTQSERLQLVGLTDDPKNADGEQIEIFTGDMPVGHLTHMIGQPRRVRVGSPDDAAPAQQVEIESGDGSRTLIRFLQSQPRQ